MELRIMSKRKDPRQTEQESIKNRNWGIVFAVLGVAFVVLTFYLEQIALIAVAAVFIIMAISYLYEWKLWNDQNKPKSKDQDKSQSKAKKD